MDSGMSAQIAEHILKIPKNIYSPPLKCGYDPYSCEWEDWATDPRKEMTLMHYGLIKSNV